MGNKVELRFKRVWDKKAKLLTAEEIVFGLYSGATWSRAKDICAFGELEKILDLRRGQDVLFDMVAGR